MFGVATLRAVIASETRVRNKPKRNPDRNRNDWALSSGFADLIRRNTQSYTLAAH